MNELSGVSEKIYKQQKRIIDKVKNAAKEMPRKKPDPLQVMYDIEQSGYLLDPSELGEVGAQKMIETYNKLRERYDGRR